METCVELTKHSFIEGLNHPPVCLHPPSWWVMWSTSQNSPQNSFTLHPFYELIKNNIFENLRILDAINFQLYVGIVDSMKKLLVFAKNELLAEEVFPSISLQDHWLSWMQPKIDQSRDALLNWCNWQLVSSEFN